MLDIHDFTIKTTSVRGITVHSIELLLEYMGKMHTGYPTELSHAETSSMSSNCMEKVMLDARIKR